MRQVISSRPISSMGERSSVVDHRGLCAIMDPPRPECVQVAVAHGAGVRVAMITGDHKDGRFCHW
jgi:magnesium-transporting ATPase (P-type)